MIVAMLSSTIMSIFNINPQTPVAQPTPTAAPTVPAPPDTASISFDQTYVHPSGLFSVGVPTGWTPDTPINAPDETQTTMRNPSALSLLEIRIVRPVEGTTVASADDLNAFFNEDWLGSSWIEYSDWSESTRRIEGDRSIIDFNLSRSGQDYVARQVAYTDGTWIYAIRGVVPSNAASALVYLLDNLGSSLHVVDRFVGAPLDYDGYVSTSAGHLIRFSQAWTVTDAAEGAPASIAGAGTQLRVETLAAPVASAADAEAYVSGLRSGITVLSTKEVTQFDASGYQVAYSLANVDGGSESGAVLILNGENNAHVANVLLTTAGTNLNDVDAAAEDTPQAVKDALSALASFSVFTDITTLE
jgi:hypothetical protein